MFLPDTFRAPRGLPALLLMLGAAWIVVDRGLAALVGKEVLQSQIRFSRIYNGACDADIVIVGNSRGVNGFYAPDLAAATGRHVFNLSYNGLSIRMARILCDDYVARCRPPKLLILEVTNSLDAGTAVGLCQLYANQSPKLAAAWRAADPTSYWLSRCVADTFRCNGELTLRALAFRGRSDQSWINNYQMPEGMMDRYIVAPEAVSKWEFLDADAIHELRECVATAHAHGTQVMLVITPYAPGYRKQLPAFADWVRQLETAVGLPVHDLSEAVTSPSCFGDPLHMNLEGARRFLPEILPLIQETIDRESTSRPRAAGLIGN